jgi:hypothetical protein
MRWIAFVLLSCSGSVETPPTEETPIDSATVVDTSTTTNDDTLAPDTSTMPETIAVDTFVPETPMEAGCPKGTSKVGDVYKINVDAHTGDEATTEPKTDANDGKNGDNPAFRRTNVARAHTFGASYWFTSKHVDTAGEPDPKGAQYVDYVPPLSKLGAGKWEITIFYRQSDNRAPYPAVYEVHHAGGVATINRDQRLGTEYVAFPLGTFDLGCDGYVRAKDTGAESISFGHMEMKYVGP